MSGARALEALQRWVGLARELGGGGHLKVIPPLRTGAELLAGELSRMSLTPGFVSALRSGNPGAMLPVLEELGSTESGQALLSVVGARMHADFTTVVTGLERQMAREPVSLGAGPRAPRGAGPWRWDADQYLLFEGYRLRPALDLLERVDLKSPRLAYDLGCGPGNVTKILRRRWPRTRIVGIDNSDEILRRARAKTRGIHYELADLTRWEPPEAPDLIFSNAVLHLIEGHEALFPRLLGFLRRDGVLAIQIPRNPNAPFAALIQEAVRSGPWRRRLEPALRPEQGLSPDLYHSLLSRHARQVDIWETEYLHVLEGRDPVVEWVRGSKLAHLLAQLGDKERGEFLGVYSERIQRAYPPGPGGKVLFPFNRLFVVARR